MVIFDASIREACKVLHSTTNTPLQALSLMNEVTYVEAARMLAERVMVEGGATPEERVAFAYRLATSRVPDEETKNALAGAFHHHVERYRSEREEALKLVSVGDFPRNQALEVAALASYTVVASLILNLDETITKE
jgi:hypothetical protein